MRTVGVLLAGGASRRFGSPKAWAIHQERYLFEWVYDVLATVSDKVVIVTQEAFIDRFPAGLHVIKDLEIYKGQGPLAGIYSAMRTVQADYYAVLPCDMPYMTVELMRSVVEAADGTIGCATRLGERLHPLVSCWSRVMLAELQQALLSDRNRVLDVALSTGFKWLDAPFDAGLALRNVNYPDDLKEGKPS